MNGWTKLHESAVESVNLSELLDEEPEAFALFMLMLAKAGVWGRFPAHPKLLRSRVAPMSDRLTANRIAELIPLLEKHDLITKYEVDGVPLLCNTKHFTYNGKQAWHRIGKPEFPAPPGFVIPVSLAEYLNEVQAGKYKGKTVAGECAKMNIFIDQSQITPQDDSVGVVSDQSQTTPWADATLQTLDVRLQTTDVRNDSTPNDKQPSVPVSQSEPGTPPVKVPSARELKEQQRAEQLATLADLTSALPLAHRELITGYIENACAENATNRMSLSREVAETRALVDLRLSLGEDAWAYGMAQANSHRAPNLNYVRKAAEKWTPGKTADGNCSAKPAGLWRLAPDGSTEYERSMQPEQIGSIRQAIAAGTWDSERGMDRADPRHPDHIARMERLRAEVAAERGRVA